MKKLLLIFASVLGLAAALGAVGVVYSCPHLPARLYHRVFLGEDFVATNVRFRMYQGASASMTPEGYSFSESWRRSTDCVEVLNRVETYASPEKAEDRIRSIIDGASEVLERNEKVYADGTREGPRAVVFRGKREQAVIIWIWKENKVVTVESSSLPHALEFERRTSKRLPTKDH
ncbi:MAG TPA: hypothetical protein VLB32_00970 [Candidatus Acidoferrales bacterium]|nr:hypothetical protein [Candidatus Acidoferrales bacterium]